MLPSTSPAVEAKSVPQPIGAGERLTLVDVLRGFALGGVCLSNVYMWFSGRIFLPRAQLEAMFAHGSVLDSATMIAFGALVFGKFITLFSFLFGLGFAVQMGRAEARGDSIVRLYTRRLVVLMAIGAAHLFLLWYGDILTSYALLGFGLLLFRKRADKTLIIWAAVLIVVAPVVGAGIMQFRQLTASPEQAAALAKESMARANELKDSLLQTFSSGSYLDVVRANARYFFEDFFRPLTVVLFAIFGRFLLGLMAGRRRIFHDADQHAPLFRRLLGWGLVIGLLGSGVGTLVQQFGMRKLINFEAMPWLPLVMGPVRQLGEVGLAAVYLSGITLLFQRPAWRRVLSVLAPVGRMALSNYLAQTVISLFVFYGLGLGLIGKVGPTVCSVIALGIFVVQVGWSHLWLSRFRFGPAEWLWRSLTYGKAQPMLAAPAARTSGGEGGHRGEPGRPVPH